MRSPRFLLVVGALVLSVAALGCSSVDSPAAAKVNGEEIERDAVDDELAVIKDNEAYRQSLEQQFGASLAGVSEGSYDATFVARLLTYDIYYELVDQAIDKRGLEVGKSDLKDAEDAIKSRLQDPKLFSEFDEEYQDTLVYREASINVLSTDLAGGEISEDDIEAYYDENKDQFEERCVSHILIAPPEDAADPAAADAQAKAEADAIRAQLVAGADFATVAKESSDDPGSAQNGGSLDCITQDVNFVPEFKEAAFSLPEGELSQPVKSQFGYHIILVTEIRTLPLDEVRDQIESQLQGPAQNALLDWLVARTRASDVSVNPRYGKWQKGGDGQAGQVVPPEQPTTTTTGPGAAGTNPLPSE